MKCDSCSEKAIYFARYSGKHYCDSHFRTSVETRVKKEIRAERIFERGKKIAVAVSGGKDSMTTLHLLSRLSARRRGTEIIAVTVDEGITGYRDRCLDLISEYCSSAGIYWLSRSYREFAGFTMDMLAPAKRERSTCAYCGVFRRNLINALAKDAGADLLATGLNLDDTAQSILMNLTRGDADRLAMMGPHTMTVDGLVPRVQPLRLVPENEVLLYAMMEKIPFLNSTCPYSEEASRNLFRDIVLRIEDEMPGSRYAMLKTMSKIEVGRKGNGAGKCALCGETTSSTLCRTCSLKSEVIEILSPGASS